MPETQDQEASHVPAEADPIGIIGVPVLPSARESCEFHQHHHCTTLCVNPADILNSAI